MSKTDEIKVVKLSNTQGRAIMDVFSGKSMMINIDDTDLEKFFYEDDDVVILTEDMAEGKNMMQIIDGLLEKLKEEEDRSVHKLLVNAGSYMFADEKIDIFGKVADSVLSYFKGVEVFFTQSTYKNSDDGRISLIVAVG